jgi:hypothetical protein
VSIAWKSKALVYVIHLQPSATKRLQSCGCSPMFLLLSDFIAELGIISDIPFLQLFTSVKMDEFPESCHHPVLH